MSRQWFRVFAKSPQPDDWEGCIDVMIDVLLDESRRVIPGVTYFGIWGKVGNEDSAPFVLNKDGTVDFGCLVDLAEYARDSKMNIHEKIIQTDEYFTHTKEGDEMALQIKSVTDLTWV